MNRTLVTRAGRALVGSIAFTTDTLIAVLIVAIALITVSGGAVVSLRGHRVSATGVDNPLLAVILLAATRYILMRRIPWFGAAASTPQHLDGLSRRLVAQAGDHLASIKPARAAQAVLGALVTAMLVKALLAYANPGFFSGDDVEVQEMTLRALWRTNWSIWDLRSPFFPMIFLFPFQKLLVAAGVTSTKFLVFGGRAVVAVLSSLAVWLVWKAGRREFASAAGWAMVAAILFAIGKLHIAFGSTELPRPVSTIAVLGAYVLLHDAKPVRTLIAGVLLGMACCFRFSEAIFVPIAAFQLAWQRRFALSGALVAISCVTALAILGLGDWWYWGDGFHSVRAAIQYTLIEKSSSRGYQHAAWYLFHLPEWVNPAVFLLALAALARGPRLVDLWAWMPLLVLSCLPHKEGRYAIPALPFLCLCATRELREQVGRIRADRLSRPQWGAVGLLALLVLGAVHDVGHWRLARTNMDTVFATGANAVIPANVTVAAEQAWRLGGHLYLPSHEVIDLQPDQLREPGYLSEQASQSQWLILSQRASVEPLVAEFLRERNYVKVALSVTGSRYQLWRPPSL